MSGTSTSTTNYSSYSENKTNDMVSNTTAAVNAGATIAAGAAMVTAAAVGLAVVGTVKAVTAIGSLSVELYNQYKVKKAEEQLALHQFYLKGQHVLQQKKKKIELLNAYKSELHDSVAGFAPSAKDISPETNAALDKIDELEKALSIDVKAAEDNMLAKLESISLDSKDQAGTISEKAAEQLYSQTQETLSEWNKVSTIIEQNYAEMQTKHLSAIKTELTAKYKSISDSIAAMGINEKAKAAQMKQLAQLAINDAEAVLCHLAARHGAAEWTSDITLLANNLKQSKSMLGIGNYTSAFSSARDISLNALEIEADISVNEAKRKNALNALTLQLARMNEEFSVDEVYFNFHDKRYKDSLRRFAKHGFSTALRNLNNLWARIYDGITLAEIAEIKHDADNLSKNFRSVYNLAFNRMLSGYYTRESASLLKSAFEAQGLTFDAAAFEGDNAGEKLHINFKTRKGETVTLIIDHDCEGKPYFEVHHYSNIPNALPDRALEESLNNTIKAVTGVSMHCLTPGKFSDSDACDLKKAQEQKVV